MSFINWSAVTAKDFATVNVQSIKAELRGRNISIMVNKKEQIRQPLFQTSQDSPNVRSPGSSTSFLVIPAFTEDSAAENMQCLATFLYQNMAVMMTLLACHTKPVDVAMLSDLSSLLPNFSAYGSPTLKHCHGE